MPSCYTPSRPVLVGLLLASAAGCTSRTRIGSSSATAVGPAIAIAIVHAGGGNAGAVFDRDFVVLVNRGQGPRSLAGLSLQYASASGTTALGSGESTRTDLPAIVLAPGAAVLVAGAAGTQTASAIPRIDVDDPTPIALATSGGRLALVDGTGGLGCNGASLPCDAAATARVLDLVSWGAASWSEGTPAAAPANGEVLARVGDGCVDTDANANDVVRMPTFVRDSASPLRVCGAIGDGGMAIDGSIPVPTDAGPDPEGGSVSLAPRDVQGRGYVSPLDGTSIRDLRGVVTYVESRRFAIEDIGEPLEANAVFVKTAAAPPVAIGNLVRVDGVVRESRPNCSGCDGGVATVLSVTTVEATRIAVIGSAALPPPFEVDGTFPDAFGPYAEVDRDRSTSSSPATDALDRLERLEARRVRVAPAVVVGPTRTTSDGRRLIAIASADRMPRSDGVPLQDPGEGLHGGAFVVLDASAIVLPFLDVGDRFEGGVVGVVDTAAGRPVLRLTSFDGAREVARTRRRPAPAADAWSLATFNVHGLAAVDSALRFASVARTIVDELASPEVLVLEEVSDDSGTRDDGTVSARETLARLVDAIGIAGGPVYACATVDPRDGEDGGAPGANIRTVVMFRPDRGLSLPSRPGSPDAPALGEGRGEPPFSPNPARLGADEGTFVDGRKPLLVELARTSDEGVETWVLVAVHLRSHLGDDPRLGRMQPPSRPNDARRLDQVVAIADLVDVLRRADPDRGIVVAGDFNDGPTAPSMAPLLERGLLPAPADDPDDEGTYVYDGLATNFDRAHLSSGLRSRVRSARPIHLGATLSNGVSDHDPMLVEFGPANDRGRSASCSLTVRPVGKRWGFLLALVATSVVLRRSRRCP